MRNFNKTLALLYFTIIKVMESYIRSVLNKFDKSGKVYQLNHYTTGQRAQVARQGLKDVSIL